MNSDSQTSVEWRPSRGTFWFWLVWPLIGVTMGVVFIVCYMHPEWSDKGTQITLLDLIFIEALFFAFTIMGLLALWGGMVSRISIGNERIEKTGPMYRRSIELEAIERIEWRTHKMIVLTGHGERLLISLGVFPPKIRENMMQILRQELANRPGCVWETFEAAAISRQQPRKKIPHSDRWLFHRSIIVLCYNAFAVVYFTHFFPSKSQLDITVKTLMITGLFFGAPSIFLLSLWELIRHDRTWRTMAALLISGLAIYLFIEPFYNMAYRGIRH